MPVLNASTTNAAAPRRNRTRSAIATASVSIAAGIAIGLVFALAARFLVRETPRESFIYVASQQALFFGGWGALVVPLWAAIGRIEPLRPRSLKLLAFIALGIGAWLTHASFLYLTTANEATAARTVATFFRYVLTAVYFEAVVYVAVASTIVGVRNQRRADAQERRSAALSLQLAHAQLRGLQAQIHPHFLFNALHSVSMLARAGDTERVVEVTAKLGDMLRAMLDDNDATETTLRDELALARQYLGVEQVRFGDRLQVRVDVSDSVLGAYLPPLILQPIIENAIQHGIARISGQGVIDVRAQRDGAMLIISVSDNGPGAKETMHPRHSEHFGGNPNSKSAPVGLKLTRDRLAALYGQHGTIKLALRPEGGCLATISLPWHEIALVAEP